MSTPKLFDVHTHTQFAAFEKDVDAVIRRALADGIWLVNVGTQKDTSQKAADVVERFSEGVYAAVGLHPIHTEKSYHDPQELGSSFPSQEHENSKNGAGGVPGRGEEFNYQFYKSLAAHPKVVAIGECGLDYYRISENTKEKQKTAFMEQIELAHEVKKPLMIHCRNAFGDLIDILQERRSMLAANPGVIHFFSGTLSDAKKLLEFGFLFSFGGVLTFARDYDRQVKYIPLDRILLETDAPYVAPAPFRGKRNEPAYVKEVAKKLSEIKNVPFEEIASRTSENARGLFRI